MKHPAQRMGGAERVLVLYSRLLGSCMWCCLLLFFFNMDHLKVFIEFVTILHLFYVLAFWLQGMWDPSTPDQGSNP